jgi:hypothetical protein
LTDSGSGSPQIIQANGTGVPVSQSVPLVTLSSTSLTFPSQAIATTSVQQTVTLTNTGAGALTVTGVTVTGNFAQVNNCPASVAPSASCTINVTFTPMASGNQFGTVSIADNAAGAPHTISLSGTGAGAQFQIASLTPMQAVPAGNPATYSLSVYSLVGFNAQVALSCSAPATITCAINPSVVTPTATQSQVATLTVGTALRTIAPPVTRIKIDPMSLLRHFSWTWLLWMIAIFMVVTVASVRRRPMTAAFGFAVVLLLVSAACGAGGSAPGVPAGTPAGTYQITVTATSGNVTTTMQVPVQVK